MSSKVTHLYNKQTFGGFADLRSSVQARVGKVEKVLAIQVEDDHPCTPPDRIEITYKGETLTFLPRWSK